MPVLEITVDTAGMQTGLDSATRHASSLNAELGRTTTAARSAGRGLEQAGREARSMDSNFRSTRTGVQSVTASLQSLGGAAKAVAFSAVVAGLISVGKACTEAMIEMERLETAFKTIGGNSVAAANQLAYIKQVSTDLGLNFIETAKGAKTFYAAIKDTSIATEADKIFKAVSTGSAALQLSAADTQGVLLAFGQMLSKGKVQAEELTGQVGERLPGALQLAAQAMGVTTAELGKMMENGELLATDLLPKLADVMQTKFGEAAKEAANGVSAAVNQMDSAWTEFKANVLSSGPVISMINGITAALRGANAALGGSSSADAEVVKFLEKQGVAKLGSRTVGVDQWGGSITESFYTEGQKKGGAEAIRLRNQAQQAKTAYNASNAAFWANNQGAYKDVLKNDKILKARGTQEKNAEALEAAQLALASEKISQAEYADIVAAINRSNEAASKTLSGGGSTKKKSSSGSSSTSKANDSATKYNATLQKLRNSVEALESSMDGTLNSYERGAKAIEATRLEAEANARVEAEELLRKGQITRAQAEETVALKTRKAELEAKAKLEQLDAKTLQEKASFYSQLAEATGDANVKTETQLALLEQQRDLWVDQGIKIEDVNRLYEIQKTKIAGMPWDKLKLHMQEYFQSSIDWGEQLGTCFDTLMDGMTDALVNFVKTGKLNFESLADSFISMVTKMMMQAAISGLFSGIGSLFSTSSASTGNLSYSSRPLQSASLGGFTYGSSGQGNVFLGGNISSFANSVVDRPTVFTAGKRFSAYALGGGLMGEAGPEAIMPLTRMGNGALGVQASGGSLPEVNINITNEGRSDAQVTGQQRNGTGGMDVSVMIKQLVAQDISSGNGGTIAKAIQNTYGVKRYARGV